MGKYIMDKKIIDTKKLVQILFIKTEETDTIYLVTSKKDRFFIEKIFEELPSSLEEILSKETFINCILSERYVIETTDKDIIETLEKIDVKLEEIEY